METGRIFISKDLKVTTYSDRTLIFIEVKGNGGTVFLSLNSDEISEWRETLQAAQDALDSFTREAKNKVADEPLTATKIIMD